MANDPTTAAVVSDDSTQPEPRPWSRRIDEKNPCTCPDGGFDRDCPRHGDVKF